MEPLAVIEDFDPFKDGDSGVDHSRKLAAASQFSFKTAPEAFGRVVGKTHEPDFIATPTARYGVFIPYGNWDGMGFYRRS